jgi:hypothetical protein
MGICYFDFTKFFETVNNISSWLVWIVFMVLPVLTLILVHVSKDWLIYLMVVISF